MALNVDQIKILVKAETKQALKNLKGIHGQSTKVSMGFKDILKTGLGIAGITSVISLVAGAVKKAVKTQMQFEQSIANVASVSGDSRKELAKLARQMGKDTIYSATQSADAMYFLASSGMKVNDMAKVLGPTLNLAAAAQMGIAEATNLVVNQLKIYQVEMDKAGEFTDYMAHTVASSNTNMQQLGGALSYTSSIAKRLNWEFSDLNVVIGGMADLGVKSERAGVQLRQAMVRLIKPSGEAKNALRKYGITQEQVNKVLHDPIKLFKLLKPVTEDAKDATALFGLRQQDVIGLIKDGIPILKKLKKGMEDAGGAAKRMADKQVDTLQGQLKLLNSAWEELILSFSKTEGMKGVVKDLREWVIMFTELGMSAEKLPKKLKNVAGGFTAVGIAAAAGAVAFGPIGAAVAALAVSTVLLLKTMYELRKALKLKKQSQDFVKDTEKIAEAQKILGEQYRHYASEVEATEKKIRDLKKKGLTSDVAILEKLLVSQKRSLAKSKAAMNRGAKDMSGIYKIALDKIGENQSKLQKEITDAMKKATGRHKKELEKRLNALREATQKQKDLYANYHSYTASEHQKAIDRENELYAKAGEGLKQKFESEKNTVYRTHKERLAFYAENQQKELALKETHIQNLSDIDKRYAEKKKSVWEKMTQAEKDSFEGVLKIVGKLGDAIGGEFGKAVNGVTQFVDSMMKAAGDPVQMMTVAVVAAIGVIVTEMQKGQKFIEEMAALTMMRMEEVDLERENQAVARLEREKTRMLELFDMRSALLDEQFSLEAENYAKMTATTREYYDLLQADKATRYAAMTADEKKKYDLHKKYEAEKKAAEDKLAAEKEAAEKAIDERIKTAKMKRFKLEKKIEVAKARIDKQKAISEVHKNYPMPWDADMRSSLIGNLHSTYGDIIGLIKSQQPAFAKGTENASTGMALVGERGPELVNFRGGEQVIPNNRISNYTTNANRNIVIENVSLPNITNTKEMLLEMQEIADGMGTSLLNV